MNQLRWLNQCLEGKRKLFWLGMVMAALCALLYIPYPFLTKVITDDVLVGTTMPDGTVFHNFEILPTLLIAIIVTMFLRNLNNFLLVCVMEDVSQNMLQKLRVRIYANLSQQDAGFFDEYRTGDLMTRLTGDMDFVRHAVAWLSYNVVKNIFLFGSAIIYFFCINTKLTLVILALTPLIFITTAFYSKSVYPLFADLREKLSWLNTTAQENISGNRAVRAFSREEYECDKFDKASKDFRKANIKTNFYWLKFYPFIELFSESFNILIIICGGLFIINGEMTPGDLMAFTLFAWGVCGPIRELGSHINDLQRFFASANKVIEIDNKVTSIKNPEHGRKASGGIKGDIEFKGVSYHYGYDDRNYALKNINLKINHGETVAIMGSTGSGKTTLINSIVRIHDVTKGKVLVDGTDVRDWDLTSLRKNVGVATQDVLLYSSSVDANIAYSNPDMPEEEVKYYANMAAAQFVESLPNGFDTVIGERGTGLSGGQKQRIALARAMAVKPSILILDDTTSAVDMETEAYIQNSLKNLPYECTKIIIAQRISSVRDADKIIVMKNGEISEMGTHDELIKLGGYYSEICELQGVKVGGEC